MTPDEVRAIVREELAAHQATDHVVSRGLIDTPAGVELLDLLARDLDRRGEQGRRSGQSILDGFKAQVEQQKRARQRIQQHVVDGRDLIDVAEAIGDPSHALSHELLELPAQLQVSGRHDCPLCRCVETPTVAEPDPPRPANP